MEAEEAQGGGTDWGFGEPRRTGCSHYNEDALIDRINWEEHLIDRMMPSIPDILGDIPLKASVGGPCSSCINSFDTSQFKNDLDEYQLKVIESITHSLSCKHSEYIIELIRGAQDSGKTNLLSTLLASIGHRLKCVVYVPSACDVVNLLNEMKHLSMPHHEYKQLCEKIIVFERTSDLGAQLEQMSMDSQECQEDRIGPSLFERLRHLGFKEHLLLKQYKHKSHSWQHERKAPEKPKPPREFSWVGRTVNTKHVLAPVRDQGNKDICALMSTIATTESLYKYSYASQNPPENFNIVLDVQDMFKKYKEECGHYLGEEPEGQGLRGLKRVDTALKVLKNHGVIGTYESDDHWKEEISLPITISSFKILERDDTAKVCRHLHDGRFLVGSMKMSYNFFEMSSGDIYHFDPQRPIINSKNGRPWLHAVMILGYGEPVKEALMEHKHKTCLTAVQTNQPEQVDIIGHLVYQNSHGALFGLSGGYGRVGWESIVSLWWLGYDVGLISR
uniref:Peptidase C1A papain C-terminal domain-containing protein n=1 Tax=Leersia perrieri TaxID=77586 RepID=A0A0D9XNS7_9ORYZ